MPEAVKSLLTRDGELTRARDAYASAMYTRNEIGEAAPRGRSILANADVQRDLSAHLGKPVELPAGAAVTSGPTSCPACGAATAQWAANAVELDREQIHPILWHETEWLADRFTCTTCDAGWYEPDDPRAFQWVRPYWIVS